MSTLYAGGSFTFVGGAGAQARRIARWNGSTWAQVGTGLNGTVDALEIFDDGNGAKLYAGGTFTGPGSGTGTFNRIVRWSGTAWEALGSGLNQRVNALKARGSGTSGRLYAGGFFTQAGGTAANFAAVWNGSTWAVPSQGDFDDYVNTFGIYQNTLYAGGNFIRGGGIRTNNLARQDAQSWAPLGNGLNEPVDALAVYNGPAAPGIYAGGAFTHAGGQLANYVAYWNGAQWLPAGSGFNDGVFSLIQHDDGTGPAVFAGGNFTQSGGLTVNHVARWNGQAWQPLLSGVNGPVYAFAVFNDGSGPTLVVGGDFTEAGGVPAASLAAWNGVDWEEFNGGVDGVAYALTVLTGGEQAGLYVGGEFANSGGTPANRVALWNGQGWSALGTGASNTVYALGIFNDDLGPAVYAGGRFTQIGGQNANRVAKWTGTAWQALGSGASNGVNNDVYSLAAFDDSMERQLIVGGLFNQAGGAVANRAAAWNGTSWSSLSTPAGNGLTARVNTLTVADDGTGQSLYIGGDFQSAGNQPRGFVTRWARPPECR